MLRRKQLALVLFVALLLMNCRSRPPPYACTDAIGCVEVKPGDPLKIGVLQNLSGPMGPQGVDHIQTTELALDDRGRVLLGHPIELHDEDSLCSAEGGTTAALKLAADPQIVGITGPTCSGAAASAMKVVSEAGLIMISGSSSAPSLTSVGGERGSDSHPGFFRTAQNDALVGRSAAAFAFQQLGVTRAATINDGDAYTQGLTDTFEQAFTELGGEVVLAAVVNKGDTNMLPVLAAVAASGAQLVFFPVFRMEGDYIVLQAAENEGVENVVLMSAEGLYFDAFIEAVGQAGVGMYFIAPAKPEGPAYDAFMSRYEAKHGEQPTSTPYHAAQYDAINLLLNAIEAVATQHPNGTLHIGRQALKDAMQATSGYEGLTGSLSCDKYGDCGVARFDVKRLDDPPAGLAGLVSVMAYTYPPDQ